MSDVVIRVENLGKLYQIGQHEGYKTLRETLTESFTRPLGRLRAFLSGNRAPGPDPGNNTIWALKDVSFEVQRGEVIGIIGRNGAGKSTLLKILSRITEPTEGYAEIRGRVGSLLEVGTGFHPELTGRENIYLNGAILGMRKAEIARKFDEIVAFAEVAKFIDTPVKHYSSGMYLRLAFAVAAHLEPEILMVDEVLAVGDAEFQKKCLGKMGDVAKAGRTILFVSHNMVAIRRLCSRGIWLQDGQIKGAGPATEIVDRYLAKGIGSTGKVFFAPRTEAKVQFRSVCITDIKGNISQYIPDDQGFAIELEVEVSETVPDIYFGLILQTLEGTNVLYSDSRDGGSSLSGRLPVGMHQIRLTYPGIFAPGWYTLVLGISTTYPVRTLDYQDGCCAFEIFNNSNMQRSAPRPGIINLNIPWNLEN